MSDYSEAYSDTEAAVAVTPVPPPAKNKKLALKRKPVPASPLDSAENSERNKKQRKGDIFAIIKGEEKAIRSPTERGAGAGTTASFTSRVSGGQSRRTVPVTEGAFYVEVKVYNLVDVQNTPPLERYKKALTSVKLRLGENTRQWEALQDFLVLAYSLFKDSDPIKFSDNIHFKP